MKIKSKFRAPVRIDISSGWPDSDPYRADHGGWVLNAAIDRFVYAYTTESRLITNTSEVPSSAGLGVSAAVRACFLAASNPKLTKDKNTLIRSVWNLENIVLKQRAGFQDQCAAVYGGVNLWHFGKKGRIFRIPISGYEADHLQRHLALVYTGTSRFSSRMHNKVFSRYPGNSDIFHRMSAISRDMAINMTNEKRMGELFNETYMLQKMLCNDIETKDMLETIERARGHYLGYKMCGAGGGGCLLFYTRTPEAFRSLPGSIPFRFDYEGLTEEKR